MRHLQKVHITFTGTGTFIVRLLQSGLVKPHDLVRKYRYELHANELVLLAYYVAAINIEETYHSLQGGNYVPFDGIVLTDTFQMFEDDDEDELAGAAFFPANNDRVIAQKSRDIRVVIGNPPYSKGQSSGNDDNANNEYKTLDANIRATYAKRSTATNKNNLYDSYIRAIRWASDRIGDQGIVGYVSNGGFIDGNTADGLRLSLMDEFTSVYIFNLRGNARTSGERRQQEKDNVFGQGSRATIAISILVKNPAQAAPGSIYYYDIGDYLTQDQKLAKIKGFASVSGIPWKQIETSMEGDWINKRNDDFAQFAPIGEKDKAKTREIRVFAEYSAGVKTNRDSWVYGFSRSVSSRVASMIAFFNGQVSARRAAISAGNTFVRDTDATRLSWNRADLMRLERGVALDAARPALRTSMYRVFQKQLVQFDRELNDMVYKMSDLFPEPESENVGFYLTAPGSGHPFSALMLDVMPDIALWGSGSGQFFPRYSYRGVAADAASLDVFEDGGSPTFERIDNVTDEILTDYKQSYGKVTKDDIFFYVYGLLHSREYRDEFEADLMKMLPRIPKVTAFKQFVEAGRALSELHLNYETAALYPLTENAKPDASLRVTKLRYAKEGRLDNRTTIIYNDDITLTGIPGEAQEYLLGSRSALDWIIERYQVKTDKASGIVNDPNAWGDEHGDPRYILDLIKRITTVSVETVKIVNGLPSLEVVGS